MFVLILWFRAYIEPESFHFFQGEDQMLLFRPFAALIKSSALVGNLVTIGMALILAFLILRLNTVYSFIRVRTFLPSNLFVLILSGLITIHSLHPVYFGTLFLLLAINRIFGAYEIPYWSRITLLFQFAFLFPDCLDRLCFNSEKPGVAKFYPSDHWSFSALVVWFFLLLFLRFVAGVGTGHSTELCYAE